MPFLNIDELKTTVEDIIPLGLAQMLNDSSIDRVMAIDTSWNIIAWNKTSETISGISASEILGKHLLSQFPQIQKDEEMMNAINMAFNDKKSYLPWSSSFNRKYYENHFIPLKNQGNKVIGVMNIMHDVAHRIKVEKQLQKLNAALEKKYQELEKANNELSTFTYITSRDIKEPMKHVYTSLELLIKKEGQTLSHSSRGNLRRMQGSLNRMNLLLDDILAVSTVGNYKRTPGTVDLNKVFNEACDKLQNKIIEKRADIKASELPSIEGYHELLTFLFHSLLDNAIKFQNDQNIPVIRVSSSLVLKEDHDQSARDEKEYECISFSDNGIGIGEEHKDAIFGMFVKLNEKTYPGSGIGLTICKKIVEAHDGFIEVESELNKGSTFLCYLPRSVSPQ